MWKCHKKKIQCNHFPVDLLLLLQEQVDTETAADRGTYLQYSLHGQVFQVILHLANRREAIRTCEFHQDRDVQRSSPESARDLLTTRRKDRLSQ